MIALNDIESAYDEYSRQVYAFIYKHVNDTDAAEDILQDVFVKIIDYSMKKKLDQSNIKALLYRIALNCCIDFSRKNRNQNTVNMDPEIIENFFPDSEKSKPDNEEFMLEILNEITNELDEPEKSILILKKSGMTYIEIAEILKISERTLKRKMKIIMEILKLKFNEKGFF